MSACNIRSNGHVFHQDTVNHVKDNLYDQRDFARMAGFFKVLNDPTRLTILEAIKDHALCVCDLAHVLGMTKSAISHQLKTLRSHKLVKGRKAGKMVYYRLVDQAVIDLITKARQHLLKGITP